MLKIKISFTTTCEEPEHYGYFSTIEEAKEALEDIRKIVGDESGGTNG